MKRLLLLFAFVCACLTLAAQDYKVLGVEPLPTDLSARENIKLDEKERQCALFRIATQNISPEMREGFHFESDYGSWVVDRIINGGEIWLWVSPGIKTLRIIHDRLGRYELHLNNYVARVESLVTYRVVLQGTMAPNPDGKQEVAWQYLAFQISPTDAELEVDGEIWPLSSRGTARRRVKEGMYHYRITALDCEDEENTVSVVDTSVVVSVTLKPISKKPTTNQATIILKQPEKEIKQPKIEQPVSLKTDSSAFFVMANVAYSIAPQTSYGLTVGSVKQLGWYASLSSNFSFVESDFECIYTGTISGANFEYSYSGEKSTSRFGATAGMVVRISDPVYTYIGGGYGFRNVFWELENGSWAKNTYDSYKGIALDAGLMLHFKGFGLSLGVQTISFNYLEAKIGLGYTLKRR